MRSRPLTLVAAGLTLATAAALVVDLARPELAEPVRVAVAAVAAPAQDVLAGAGDGEVARLTAERDALAAEVTRLEEQLRDADELDALRRASTVASADQRLLPARVVAFSAGTTPVGGRTVTLDVGEVDGVREDQTVVSADGLVGRVLRVAATSSDVLVLGDAEVVVGVRFGADGALGSVDARTRPTLPRRGHGDLTLSVLGDSTVAVGDEVRTLGSPDDRPYAPGIPLGRVTSVDPDRGQLSATAVVTPHVDTDTLDLVAVVLPEEGDR